MNDAYRPSMDWGLATTRGYMRRRVGDVLLRDAAPLVRRRVSRLIMTTKPARCVASYADLTINSSGTTGTIRKHSGV